MAQRIATRYRQKGRARRKRRQKYRANKAKSKRQSRLWRKKNRAKLKRYRLHKKRNPNLHKLRRRAASERVLADQVPFWDLETDQEGEVESVLPEDEQVKTRIDGEERIYNLFDFLDSTALMDEETEGVLFELLDQLYDSDEEGDDEDFEEEPEELVERVARQYAARRRKLPKSVLISAVVQFRHEGRLVVATVERTNWLGGDQMMYYWKTQDGRRIETLGLPDDLVVLDKGR